jgi:hypothetical protein
MLAVNTDVNRIDYRSAESFNFAVRIERPWGWIDPVIKWCREEMQGEWRWQMVSMSTDRTPGDYIFYFDSERDYCAFCLKYR